MPALTNIAEAGRVLEPFLDPASNALPDADKALIKARLVRNPHHVIDIATNLLAGRGPFEASAAIAQSPAATGARASATKSPSAAAVVRPQGSSVDFIRVGKSAERGRNLAIVVAGAKLRVMPNVTASRLRKLDDAIVEAINDPKATAASFEMKFLASADVVEKDDGDDDAEKDSEKTDADAVALILSAGRR